MLSQNVKITLSDRSTCQLNHNYCFLSEEEFKKYYRMPGWGKPLYEMKEAEIPKGDVPSAFDWRDKGN